MEKNKKKFKKFFKKHALIFFGLILILIFCVWRYHQVRILSFTTKNQEISQNNSEGITPVYIKAYPVGVDIEVKPSSIINGVWTVYPNSAGFIRNKNNLIIYGHNKIDIMGPIRWIKKEARITIKGDDGQDYEYSVVKIDEVAPDNLEYLKSTDEETLIIYTCTGFLDTKRFIVVAKRTN